MRPLGGLLTAAAITVLGFITSDALSKRQAIDTNTRLYTELMSRREESESALRKDMCVSIISSFVNPRDVGLSASVLNLEMLAYNFHESLNLKPLFTEMRRRVIRERAEAKTRACPGRERSLPRAAGEHGARDRAPADDRARGRRQEVRPHDRPDGRSRRHQPGAGDDDARRRRDDLRHRRPRRRSGESRDPHRPAASRPRTPSWAARRRWRPSASATSTSR